MKDELKLCPFCGMDAEIVSHAPSRWGGTAYAIECTNCGNQTEQYVGGKAEAITAWNRRAETQEVGDLLRLLLRVKRSIEVAIYSEDGLDGGHGEKLLREIDDALVAHKWVTAK